MFWIIPLFLLIILESLADVFSKEYALKGKWQFWVLAIVGYIAANVFWLWAIRSGSGLARGAIIFSVVSAVLALIIGVYIYGEETNKFQFAGMLLGIVSIALLFWE